MSGSGKVRRRAVGTGGGGDPSSATGTNGLVKYYDTDAGMPGLKM